MDRLIIAGRLNEDTSTYIRFKAQKNAMRILKQISQDMGDDFTEDAFTSPKTLTAFDPWQDQYLHISSKRFEVRIIVGHAIIHFMVDRAVSIEALNQILDKYCVWAKPIPLKKVKKAAKNRN